MALVVDNITREFGGKLVVGPISFRVKENSLHGFLGPNGAGKSTTFKIISRLLKPTSGEVFYFGKKEYSQNILGILPENAPLMLDMTIESYLNYVLALRGFKNREIKEKVESTLETLSLVENRKRLVGNLSKGYKQRVGIAQALIFNPKILLLDEPTVGLDPEAVFEMRELLMKLKKEHTILLSSHILSEVQAVVDEVTIINQGKIFFSGPIEKGQNLEDLYFKVTR